MTLTNHLTRACLKPRGIVLSPLFTVLAGDRHRFLGFSTLLLSGLSFVATIFVALCVVNIRSCA